MTAIPRIFHGPANICGMGGYIAAWQRKEKNASADFIVFSDNTPFQNSDENLHFEKKRYWAKQISQIQFFFWAVKKYDLFHFYFGKTLLPASIDLPILRLLGKKIIMNYVGSDIRLYRLQIKANPYYHLRKAKSRWDHFDLAKRARMIWQGLWFHYCFAGPALYAHARTSIPKRKIIRDTWINKTLKVPKTQPDPARNQLPLIIHAPTDVHTKGTSFIEQSFIDLQSEGLQFTYRIYQGLPHDELMEKLIEGDILVDQLISGGYGTIAMEGMAFGKPVCGFVMPSIRKQIPDLPIVQCTVETIKDQLRDLIEDKEKREKIGREGWEFARKHFDREKIYEDVWQMYLSLWNN